MTGVKNAPRERDSQDRWLDDNPVERMKVIRERLGGIEDEVEGKPYGRNLRCPMPICHGKHTLKIGIGRLRNRLVVRCKNRAHNQNALVRAVTKATGVSLFPRPRPASPSEIMGRMLHAVEQMRLTPQYEGLSPLSKALVEHLVEAIFDNGESNGGIDRTGTNLMGVFDIHSWRQFYEAVNEAIDAGIVFRGSRGLSHGYKSGPSNLWGLACLPDEREGRSSKRAKASPKPHKNVSRLRNKGGRTWWENVQKVGERAAQPFDNTSYDLGSYVDVRANPLAATRGEPEEAQPATDQVRAMDAVGEASWDVCWDASFSSPAGQERSGMDEPAGLDEGLNPDAWPP